MTQLPKVENFTSPRSYKAVANQFKITIGNKIYFQSYKTIIAVYDKGILTVDTGALDYSTTTCKYLYEFTGNNRKEILAGIKEKIIKVKNLNK